MVLLGKVALSMRHLEGSKVASEGYGLDMVHREQWFGIQFWKWSECSRQSYQRQSKLDRQRNQSKKSC